MYKYGIYTNDNIEIYGYSEKIIDEYKIPSVIGATLIYRNDINIKHDDIVIYDNGYGFIYTLCCLDAKIYKYNGSGERKDTGLTFDQFFLKITSKTDI